MAVKGTGKTLIVYYSLSGKTAQVAQEIARHARADVEMLRDFDREPPLGCLGYIKASLDALRGKPAKLASLACDPRDYSLVIIGTPVWAGQMTPAARAFLERYKNALARVALFVTSGNTDVSKIAPSVEKIVGHKAEGSVGFNAKELADARLRGDKITGFLQAIRDAPGASGLPVAVTVV